MPLLGIFSCNGILGGSYSIFKRTNWNLVLREFYILRNQKDVFQIFLI